MRSRVEPEKFGLTVQEAAALSGLGRNTLLRLLQTGQVAGRKIGRRRWLVFRPSLEEWLASGNRETK